MHHYCLILLSEGGKIIAMFEHYVKTCYSLCTPYLTAISRLLILRSNYL